MPLSVCPCLPQFWSSCSPVGVATQKGGVHCFPTGMPSFLKCCPWLWAAIQGPLSLISHVSSIPSHLLVDFAHLSTSAGPADSTVPCYVVLLPAVGSFLFSSSSHSLSFMLGTFLTAPQKWSISLCVAGGFCRYHLVTAVAPVSCHCWLPLLTTGVLSLSFECLMGKWL